MAEAVGLVASIVGLATAGLQVSRTLFNLANELKSAGDDVRFIAADTNALSLVLNKLSRALKANHAAASEGEELAAAIILLCRSVIKSTEQLAVALKPLVVPGKFRLPDVVARVRFVFEKSEFKLHQQNLNSLKSTLNLLVSTISFGAAATTTAPAAETEALKIEVQNLRAEIQGHRGAAGPLQMLSTMVSDNQSSNSLLPPGRSSVTSSRSDAPINPAENASESLHDEDSMPRAPESPQVFNQESAPQPQSTDVVPIKAETGTHDDLEDEYGCFSTDSAESYLEILLIRKRVLRYSEVILDKPESDFRVPTGVTTESPSERTEAGIYDLREEVRYLQKMLQEQRHIQDERDARSRNTGGITEDAAYLDLKLKEMEFKKMQSELEQGQPTSSFKRMREALVALKELPLAR